MSGSTRTLRSGSSGAKVPTERLAQPRPIGRWVRQSVVGLTPGRLAGIISDAERGHLEDWADVAETMLREDPHIRSVYETYIRGVIASDLRFEPADDSELAQRAADFCADAWARVRGSERTLEHLLHGEGVFAGVVEHDWNPVRTEYGTAWLSTQQHRVQPRDVRFASDWSVEVRTWETGVGLGYEWLRTDDEPNAWMIHVPGGVGLPPQLAGVLLACAWSWLFKKWAINFRQQALERLASPIVVGSSVASAHEEARAAFLSALEDLSANGAIVLEGGQGIELLKASTSGADEWNAAIRHYEDECSKAILGSTVNVEGSSTGGNGSRAVADSQDDVTITPRLIASAKRLAETVRHQFCAPTLQINARLFGGQMPPMPEPRFVLEREPEPVITQLHVDGGVVSRNELRASAGLEPWDAEQGGAEIVVPIAKTAPGFDRREEVAPEPAPFARAPRPGQMQLPLTTRRTSPTRSDSPTRTASVPWSE
jgi:phage gp29-like protein